MGRALRTRMPVVALVIVLALAYMLANPLQQPADSPRSAPTADQAAVVADGRDSVAAPPTMAASDDAAALPTTDAGQRAPTRAAPMSTPAFTPTPDDEPFLLSARGGVRTSEESATRTPSPPATATAAKATPVSPRATPTRDPEKVPAAGPGASKGEEIVAVAMRFLGYAYTWGGHAPGTGFDCSGFTWYVYKLAGIGIPLHDLLGQFRAGPSIKRAELQPGDLVFFQNTYKAGISHGGIYVGGGRFIDAADVSSGVRYDNLNSPYWSAHYYGASRPR